MQSETYEQDIKDIEKKKLLNKLKELNNDEKDLSDNKYIKEKGNLIDTYVGQGGLVEKELKDIDISLQLIDREWPAIDSESIEQTRKKVIERTYGVELENIESYIKRMNKLYNNMNPVGKQSNEYKAVRSAVENIKNLAETYDLNSLEGRRSASEQIVQLNSNLLAVSTKYMSDKEAVRGSDEGIYRFDNTLDALGIMCKFAPNVKEQVKPVIDKINTVRKVGMSDKNYVRLSDYDEMRAEKVTKYRQKEEAAKLKEQNKKNTAKKTAVKKGGK